ncbi:hypothetical protein LAZ67_11001991 [Cordylochernes scorpioides]|uniref:Uncharacterized protein n=1 Tax=Cordylochernes scorpioides TaxID=51811 RepID=A0ABY6L1L1_9ARAC|nr:hypothetical protein LAZ67_11001991 [Cordylochernes scorpioides]
MDKHRFEDRVRVANVWREKKGELCRSMQIVQGYGGVLSMMVEGVLLWHGDRSWADLVMEEVRGSSISVVEDQEDHPEDNSTNFQEEVIPTQRTQQPQTLEEISGPITRSRALRQRRLRAAFCRYARHCHHRRAAAATLLVSLSYPPTSGKAERYCQRKGVPLERWFSDVFGVPAGSSYSAAEEANRRKEPEGSRATLVSEVGFFLVEAALENNIGEVRTECKRLDIELARVKSLEGAVISRTGRNIPPPTFDGQTSLEGFRRQFEAVTLNNGWGETEKVTNLIVALRGSASDLLQAVPRADQQSYAILMGELELRYGEQHLKQVYQGQLKLRRQKVGESLQGFEADVKRLCHLAYPGASIDFLDQWAAQTFIDGIRDVELQRVLRLASFDKSREALVRALEVEAAYRVSESGYPRVRGAELIAEQSTTGGGGNRTPLRRY